MHRWNVVTHLARLNDIILKETICVISANLLMRI
jgi:hypothetical protein